jgi:hypothetical protein
MSNAAGPWCYDVENAPKDGSNVLCQFNEVGCDMEIVVFWSGRFNRWFDGFGRSYEHNLLRAFASINAPEVDA